MKRWLNTSIIATSPIVIFALAVGAWVFIFSPALTNYIKSQVPKINSSQDFVIVNLDSIDISLLRLQATVKNTRIEFLKQKLPFSDIKAEKILLQIDPFKLLIGQIESSHIVIENASWHLDESQLPTSKSTDDLPLDELFNILPETPIRRLIIKNTEFIFSSQKNKVSAKIHANLVILTNLKKSLELRLDDISLLVKNQENPPVPAKILGLASLTNQTLNIQNILIKTGNSNFEASAQLDHFKKIKTTPQGEVSFKGNILGENIRDIYLAWFPQKKRFPVLRGIVDLKGKVRFKDIDHANGQIAITTHDISVDHFRFGDAHIESKIINNQLQFEQIKIEHPSGLVELKNVRIQQSKPYSFQTDIVINEFDLHKMFISLGLNNVPAGLNAIGNLTCQGKLSDGLDVHCAGKIDSKDVWVKPSLKDNFYIVKIPKAVLDGSTHITQEKVTFSSKINLPNSAGESHGEVDFEKGFNIDFSTEHLDMNDVEDLAQLNMRGVIKLKGNTLGNSDYGKINADISATDLEVDRFRLGYLAAHVRYDKSKLYLEDIVGKLNETSYAGQIQFDFLKSNLLGLFKAFHIEGEDIITALNKRFDIPFEISGKGQAEVEVSGPFDFWKLSYDLKTQLNRGEIAGESFDQLKLHLIANGKFIQFAEADLSKPRGMLRVNGFIQTDPRQNFDLNFKTNQLTIEDIDHVARLLPNMTGMITFNGNVNGPISDPTVKSLFNAKKINFDGVDYSNSSGEISINKKEMLMHGQIIGRQIQTDLKWPWNPKDEYYLKTQLRDLSLFSFLPAISLPMPSSDYYSRVSAEIDLKGRERKLESTLGYIKLNELVLQRGVHILKLNRQAQLTFENGIKNADTLYLSGEGNSLIVKPQLKNNEAKFYIEADLQLKLFQFLTPFLDSLSGQLTANTSLNLSKGQIQMLGDGSISNTYLKVKGFPVPIEEVETPIQFSQSKIIFDDITALIGSRDLNGSGFVDIKGHGNVLVDLNVSSDNLEITFPEKITTHGKSDLRFTGNWMPYTLKVDYKVLDGLIEKDFGQEEKTGVTILSTSPYLPQSQIIERTPSVLLDVNVDLSDGVVVKNQLIQGEARGRLNITGTPEQPQIVGRIEIEKGSQLFFRDKPFIVDNAVINFSQGREINPTVYITANSRVAEYDINLLVQGPSKNIQIKPTSQPPLSENDIFSLLALGYTTHDDQTLSSETQQKQAGIEALATITNQSQFNKKIQDTFGLTVQLAPSIDSTKNIAVPKVVVSKQIQKKINASYSRPLSGDNLTNEFKLQYLFNPNFSVNLNYQNSERNQQENIQNYNQNENGIFGSDVEYKLEFK